MCLFFSPFLWAKCKRQFSVPFLSCSSSRVDHVCVFLFEQINDDDDDDDDKSLASPTRVTFLTVAPPTGNVKD